MLQTEIIPQHHQFFCNIFKQRLTARYMGAKIIIPIDEIAKNEKRYLNRQIGAECQSGNDIRPTQAGSQRPMGLPLASQ